MTSFTEPRYVDWGNHIYASTLEVCIGNTLGATGFLAFLNIGAGFYEGSAGRVLSSTLATAVLWGAAEKVDRVVQNRAECEQNS